MSNFENGFILINKAIKTTNIANSLDFLWLYVYFCLNVQFNDREYILNWQNIQVEKLSMYYSQLSLSQHFGISLGKINKMIKCLEKWGMCENKNDNKKSFIKLKKEYCFFESWKQNENQMKTKWNKINKSNKLNNIYILIGDYFFKNSWIRENIDDLNINITFEDFKKSFDNYLLIRDSEKTFYNYKFTLRQFLNSEKWFKQFLNCKFEDFISWTKAGEIEFEKTQEKRSAKIQAEKIEQFNEEQRLENKKIWLDKTIKSLSTEQKTEILDIVKENLKGKYTLATTAVLTANFNIEVAKKFHCPY